MRRLLRWTGYALAGLVGLVLIIMVAVYAISERIIRRTYDVPGRALVLPADSASIAEGRRLATIRGCYGGCHGRTLEGALVFDEPGIARLVAPNLTTALRRYDDAQLERVIRRGVKQDGRSVFGMPSTMFATLSDDDLACIIAFLRSQPEVPGTEPQFVARPFGRLGLVLGQFRPGAVEVAEGVPAAAPPATGGERDRGRYLAQTICTECHGADLHGDPSGSPPDLVIAAAYSDTAFHRLMREGVPLGGRELGLMKEVALSRFRHLTDAEIDALYSYLHALADTPPEGSPVPPT
ncbi:MAG TPA: cytochrome c [Longimicrobiales bacterium]|nr:cytochrome c [Longimicrobiales bacterium]